MITLAEFVRSTPFFLIAHRGASGQAPEHTLRAIELALQSGVAMVEIDVQTTSDAALIVFHDAVLGRTTNGHGHVRNTTVDEIRRLDAGSWFDAQFATEKVPLLNEALELIRGQAYLNVEIKPRTEDPQAVLHAASVLRAIEDFDMLRYTVFSSFDHELLHGLKTLEPSIHACALNVPGDTRLPSAILSACNADAFGCSLNELTHIRSNDCKTHNIPWGVYTINTHEQLALARAYGITAGVTNFPALLRNRS